MTFKRVQVSIANWVAVSAIGGVTIFGTTGCQTAPNSSSGAAAANKAASSLDLNVRGAQSPAQQAASAPVSTPKPGAALLSKTPTARRLSSAAPSAPAPAAVLRQPSDLELLRDRVSGGRIVEISSDEIIAVPLRGVRTRNDPPSLMEDAIVTSAVQNRINSDPSLRRAGVKCRTSSGVVTIRGGELSVTQQATVLNAALQQENVREVHLLRN